MFLIDPFRKSASLGAALLILLAGRAPAQTPAPAPAESGTTATAQKFPEGPHVRIVKTDWGPHGELVLAVQIHAGKQDLTLGSLGPDTETAQGAIIGYSLAASALEDKRTGQRLTPLTRRIKKPYFGPLTTMLNLKPKGWIQLGVAFPHPAASPGKNAKGEFNPYELLFIPPGSFAPVAFEVPYNQAAQAAAQRVERRAR